MPTTKVRKSSRRIARRKVPRPAVRPVRNSNSSETKIKLNGKPHNLLEILSSKGERLSKESAVLTVSFVKGHSGTDLTEKIKELVRLAQEQGYLTYGDINDSLPEHVISPSDLDEIYSKLRNLEIEIVDQAEVDRVKQPEHEEEEDKARLDILDDPVRMYLKQMGQIALLSREQEVEISKRIEDAESEVKRIIYSFGFAGKEHIALAEKLISEPPKERFDRVIVDKKIDGREDHLKDLRKLVKKVRAFDQTVDEKYADWRNGSNKAKRERYARAFRKLDDQLQRLFARFFTSKKSSRKWRWSPTTSTTRFS